MGKTHRSNMDAQPMNQTNQKNSKFADWRARVSSIQSQNCSQEKVAAIRAKASRSQRARAKSSKCKSIQMCNAVNQRSWNMAMNEFSEAAAAPAQAQQAMYAEARSKASRRMQSSVQVMQAEECQEEMADQALDMLSEELHLDSDCAQLQVSVETDLSEMEQLLHQLRREPAVAAEVEAKFELFEKYLETVCVTRGTLFEFWAECKDEFNQAGQTTVQKSIEKVDCDDALGVDFVEGRWFVYDMTRKAGSNNSVIARVLQSIKTKLDLMAEQEDCPICLEAFSEEVVATTLGCCHKVCSECWECWNEQMHGGHAFCPLCRHDDFLGNFV